MAASPSIDAHPLMCYRDSDRRCAPCSLYTRATDCHPDRSRRRRCRACTYGRPSGICARNPFPEICRCADNDDSYPQQTMNVSSHSPAGVARRVPMGYPAIEQLRRAKWSHNYTLWPIFNFDITIPFSFFIFYTIRDCSVYAAVEYWNEKTDFSFLLILMLALFTVFFLFFSKLKCE